MRTHARYLSPPRPDCGLLRLPYRLRQRIYFDAGLVSGSIISLNSRNKLEPQDRHRYPDANLPGLGLLFTCKTIHREVEELLYSNNTFGASQVDPGGLRGLEFLGARAVQHLRSLVIDLAVCAFAKPNGHVPTRPEGLGYRFLFNRADATDSWGMLRRRAIRQDVDAMDEWNRVCAHLATNVTLGRLRLYVIANVQDIITAELVVHPLPSLPRLTDCGLFFWNPHISERSLLRRLVKETVFSLLRQADMDQPFRFFDLPREIQLDVLRYSHLVSSRPIHYHSDGKTSFQVAPWWVHSSTNDTSSLIPDGCFCSAGDLTAFRASCISHNIQTTLFRVCKEFQELATEIFYAENRFVFHSYKFEYVHGSNLDSFGMFLRFASAPPTDKLKHLTRVALVLPPMSAPKAPREVVDWEGWLETIDTIAKKLKPPKLTLEIHIHYKTNINLFLGSFEDNSWENLDHLEEQQMQELYKGVLQPLIKLKGLRNLFVHIPTPANPSKEEVRIASEMALERMVMGAHYDSYANGKANRSQYSQK